ncbi:hypothetical protein LCGC14_2052080 [marine sediment metagenome]|uniref:DinB-like domain-containing protein n=1 Tax=marine sediment metagenome TaxID=412755 RepID=A0A0F9ENN5_9ZZZZ
MVSVTAASLRDKVEQRLSELDEALAGMDEAKAGQRAADGEWCCKEVLSHLMGDEGESYVAGLRRFIDEDTPLIGVMVGLPYYTPARQAMSLAEMRAGVRRQYQEVADFLADLSDEQLSRKAQIPLLKDTPIGEYATLAQWVGALLNLHLPNHINQVRNARQALTG